jgi:hypothetical protein
MADSQANGGDSVGADDAVGADRQRSNDFTVKAGLAQMLKGGVIMDVVNAEQVRIIPPLCPSVSAWSSAWTKLTISEPVCYLGTHCRRSWSCCRNGPGASPR